MNRFAPRISRRHQRDLRGQVQTRTLPNVLLLSTPSLWGAEDVRKLFLRAPGIVSGEQKGGVSSQSSARQREGVRAMGIRNHKENSS